jgi:drug/metabolite transporter (DMT)-like permease
MMTFIPYLSLLLALSGTAASQLWYKKYATSNDPLWYRLAIAGFLFTVAASFFSLRALGADTVYLSTSITTIPILIFSKLWLGESIGKNRIFGSILIILGMLLYAVR